MIIFARSIVHVETEKPHEIGIGRCCDEYALRTLESELNGSNNSKLHDKRIRERAIIAFLKYSISAGWVRHKYNAKRSMEEFRASESLVRRWRHDFPDLEQIVDPSETIIVKIGGKRFCVEQSRKITQH
jgi:hypothetical protein